MSELAYIQHVQRDQVMSLPNIENGLFDWGWEGRRCSRLISSSGSLIIPGDAWCGGPNVMLEFEPGLAKWKVSTLSQTVCYLASRVFILRLKRSNFP